MPLVISVVSVLVVDPLWHFFIVRRNSKFFVSPKIPTGIERDTRITHVQKDHK
jgi:hypothetical protein